MRNTLLNISLSVITLFFASLPRLNAQQVPYLNFPLSNWQFINPAAIDRSHYLSHNHHTVAINTGSRLQWGLPAGSPVTEGAPKTYFVSAEYCPELVRNEPGIKWGIAAFGDQTGAIGTYGLYGNFSYFVNIGRFGAHYLHLGVSSGVVSYSVNPQKIRLHNPDDPIVQLNGNRWFADFAIGAMYRYRKSFYLGFSIPQTFGLNLKKRSDRGIFETDRRQHLYLTTGWYLDGRGSEVYNRELPTIVTEPFLMVRYVPGVSYQSVVQHSPFSVMGGARVYFRVFQENVFWVGASYGTHLQAQPEIGYKRKAEGDAPDFQISLAVGIPAGPRIQNLGISPELSAAIYFR